MPLRTTGPVWLALAAAGCLDGLPIGAQPEALYGECEAHAALETSLREAMGDKALERFESVSIDARQLREAFQKGEPVGLPIITAQGEMAEVELRPVAQNLLDRIRQAQIKGEQGEFVQSVDLVPDLHFQLGCEKSDVPCGAFTFLDADGENPVMYEAMILDPVEGVTILESVPSLFENLGIADQIPDDKCGVLYNSVFHGAIPFDDQPGEGQPLGGGAVEGKSWIIPIVLDSDATFYNQNPATAWARQRSMLFSVNMMYHLIEPLSSGAFDILFALKAQEAWTTPGSGPNELNRYDLLDRINDPAYEMITHPGSNEVSFFFAGYDLTGGIAGVAGGICNVAGYDDTFGSAEAHQKNHAWGQQVPDVDGAYAFATYFGRTIVMAHEIGHMVGATHSAGSASDCAGGGMPSLCGSSMMKSGAAGGVAPDFRQPFFTDANDANIIACVGDAIP